MGSLSVHGLFEASPISFFIKQILFLNILFGEVGFLMLTSAKIRDYLA